MTHQEDTLQESISLTCEERARVRAGKGGHIAKSTLKNIVRP